MSTISAINNETTITKYQSIGPKASSLKAFVAELEAEIAELSTSENISSSTSTQDTTATASSSNIVESVSDKASATHSSAKALKLIEELLALLSMDTPDLTLKTQAVAVGNLTNQSNQETTGKEGDSTTGSSVSINTLS